MIRAVALASGSNGNAIHVETPDVRLLFDAGLSGRRLEARARSRGIDLARTDALVVSHDHHDHMAGAGVVHRRYDIPLFATTGTWSAIRGRMGRACARTFRSGSSLRFGATTIHTIPTPHDGTDGVAFVVEHGAHRFGVLTDLGHAFPELLDTFATLDAAFLEANYDPAMLLAGTYPAALKGRIAGPRGHLSNEECASVAEEAGAGRLRSLVLCHLSGENNSPELALDAARPLAGRGVEVRVALRTEASDFVVLED